MGNIIFDDDDSLSGGNVRFPWSESKAPDFDYDYIMTPELRDGSATYEVGVDLVFNFGSVEPLSWAGSPDVELRELSMLTNSLGGDSTITFSSQGGSKWLDFDAVVVSMALKGDQNIQHAVTAEWEISGYSTHSSDENFIQMHQFLYNHVGEEVLVSINSV